MACQVLCLSLPYGRRWLPTPTSAGAWPQTKGTELGANPGGLFTPHPVPPSPPCYMPWPGHCCTLSGKGSQGGVPPESPEATPGTQEERSQSFKGMSGSCSGVGERQKPREFPETPVSLTYPQGHGWGSSDPWWPPCLDSPLSPPPWRGVPHRPQFFPQSFHLFPSLFLFD